MNKHTYTVNRISRKSIRSMSTRPQEGQSIVEYSLLLGLIAVAVIAVISVLGVQLNNTFTSVTDSLGGTSVPYTPGSTAQAAATPGSNNGGSGNSGSSGSGGSGSDGSGSGGSGSGGSPTTAAATTAAPTATPVPTTAAPTATPIPTTAPATTAAPTTAAPTATAKPATTQAPTSTPVPTTAAPTATPVPTTAAPTATQVPTTAASGAYSVSYNVVNQWPQNTVAFQIDVVITNKSNTAVNNWNITWKLDNKESIITAWGGGCSISGNSITCSNPSDYNYTIPANGSITFTVQLNSPNGNLTQPATFKVNGTTVTR